MFTENTEPPVVVVTPLVESTATAVAEVPALGSTVPIGAVVYPKPPVVTAIETTYPVVSGAILAIAVAPLPLPPTNETVDALVYPAPDVIMYTTTTPPDGLHPVV